MTATEQVTHCLAEIEKKNASLNAFVEVFAQEALEAAAKSDRRRAEGRLLSPMDGVPFGIKDNFAYQGHAMTCASKILQGYRAPYSAFAVQRLLAAGMIPLGRTNMDEFAMGNDTEFSCYGSTQHPTQPGHTTGGSSGGSAAAVAAGLVPCALGSDTGGSIRQPAAFCGVVGIKPTYGAISRYGLTAFCSSLDHVGFLCQNTALAWQLLTLLRGGDVHDATCDTALLNQLPNTPAALPLKGLRIGLWDENTLQAMQPEVQAVWLNTLRRLEQAGAVLLPMPFAELARCGAVYEIISCAEASANLSRYDGIRYGCPAQGTSDITEQYERTRTEGFGDEVRVRLLIGAAALANHGRDYFAAMRAREQISRSLQAQLEACDVLLTPATPCTAPLRGENRWDPIDYAHSTNVYLVPQSISGDACITVPGGEIGGQMVGLCLTAKKTALAVLLGAAMSLERLLAE